jgi:hypothetical protein
MGGVNSHLDWASSERISSQHGCGLTLPRVGGRSVDLGILPTTSSRYAFHSTRPERSCALPDVSLTTGSIRMTVDPKEDQRRCCPQRPASS